MDDAKRELLHSWLLKASHDLAAARLLAQGGRPILDVAIYHCQQAAEKAVKAFLVFNDEFPDRTHDVDVLIQRGMPFEPGLVTLRRDSAHTICDPFSVSSADQRARANSGRGGFE
jgi:HEPN domain-containing protein